MPLLEKVDEMAERLGQSRAAVINFAIFQGLESGLQIDPAKDFNITLIVLKCI